MINEYLTYLKRNRGYSDNTIAAYKNDLKAFVRFATVRSIRWSTLTKTEIDTWVSEMHDTYKPATINRRVTAVRSMLQWAMRNDMIQANPARFVQAHKKANTLPEKANEEALERYLNTNPSTEASVIVHALVAILMDTGCRLQEAIDIRTSDVDPVAQSIKIHGKGKKERIVYYTTRTITHCVRTANRRIGYLLPISDQRTLRYMFYEQLRPYTRTHPHAIRHLWATRMLTNGADINAVASLMGHASVKTTERYTHLSNEWLKSQYINNTQP